MYRHSIILLIALFIVSATTLGSFWISNVYQTKSFEFGFPLHILEQDYSKYGNGEVETEKFPVTIYFNPNIDSTRFPKTFLVNNFWIDYVIFVALLEIIIEVIIHYGKKLNF
ncbi:hypothetical protein IPJ91_01480 [bacterium]|nr:MAG: hypothetical protein IPJ91_01480 [bacterium]